MPIDMKKMIAEAAWRLLTEKKVRKLTVKDIVEECHITRQSFYYHFEDIPDLLRWVLEQGLDIRDIMAWEDIYTYLEKCADACEEIADSVENVVMKNS